jgi:hypothetical protein
LIEITGDPIPVYIHLNTSLDHAPDFGLMADNVRNDVAGALIEEVTDARVLPATTR